jgi:IS1 family transposase
VALDPDSKLLISWQVGNRDEKTGLSFLADLNSRVEDRVLITTDGFPLYKDAIKKIFGTMAEHVVVQKNIESWRNPETGERGTRVIEFTKVPQTRGPIDLALASTSLVERLNASIRNFSSRFTRQTFKFSKKLSNHVHAQAIFVMYYNFVRQHDGLKGAERHWTPAMKAGRSNRIWSYDDLLNEVDDYWRHKAMQPTLRVASPRQYTPLAAGESSSLPYFVMYSPIKREAKVHKGHCGNCRQGVGRKASRAGSNEWYAFETEREARRCAEALAPVEHSVCSLCVKGTYVKHQVRSI